MNQYAIIAIVWIASLVSVGAWQNSAGRTAERVMWQGREVAELSAANAKIIEITQKARETERNHATALSVIASIHEAEIQHATEQRAIDIAAIRAGTLKLRDPAASVRSCSDSMPGIAAGPGVGDGRSPGELSPRAAEFLLGEASRADSVAEQLATCQQVVRSDRANWPAQSESPR